MCLPPPVVAVGDVGPRNPDTVPHIVNCHRRSKVGASRLLVGIGWRVFANEFDYEPATAMHHVDQVQYRLIIRVQRYMSYRIPRRLTARLEALTHLGLSDGQRRDSRRFGSQDGVAQRSRDPSRSLEELQFLRRPSA